MKKILVTGAEGQLGKCIQGAASRFPEMEFVFAGRADLDIEDAEAVQAYFSANTIDYCINTAGYTQVDAAEKNRDKAFSVNAEALKTLSKVCKSADTVLAHISTDYVFDGEQRIPYTEDSSTNPLSVYGKSKLQGEVIIKESGCKYFIIRTSWLYSQHGNNFLHTILRHAEQAKSLTITTEQTGTPTNANDLADGILKIIATGTEAYGLYHFSNEGTATWYDFAERILDYSGYLGKIVLAKTDHYPTFAARPAYSVLDTTKFEQTFSFHSRDWKEALKEIINSNNL